MMTEKPVETPNAPARDRLAAILASEEGRIGYVIAWLLGVPSSVLLLIFLIRGH